MSLAGRLETLELPALLQTLSVSQASGRLSLTRLDRHAVLVLRNGRVLYASGGERDETLAGRLLRQGLVGEREIIVALERQHDGTAHRRLGDALVQMGVLAEGTLHAVIRQHMQEVVARLLGWQDGFFRFDPLRAGEQGDVEVDRGDFVLPGGLPPEELLMHAVTSLDRDQHSLPGTQASAGPPAAGAPPVEEEPSPPTGSYVADYTGEAVLSLLRFASQIVARAVVFSIEGEHARSVGEFGARTGGRPGIDTGREAILSLKEPSVLRVAVERARTYVGPLEPTRVNLQLLELVGGGAVNQALALPLLVGGEVRFVLYGDDAAQNRPRRSTRSRRPPGGQRASSRRRWPRVDARAAGRSPEAPGVQTVRCQPARSGNIVGSRERLVDAPPRIGHPWR
jgi:hypothetical protein